MAETAAQLDDETLARRFKNADARAKQGDAKAGIAAKAMAAEINKRRAGTAAPSETGPARMGAGTQQGAVPQYASGVTEGLTRNIVGPIVDAAQGVVNLPKRAYDAAMGQEYDPMFEGSVGTTDWWNEALQTEIPDIPLPFTDDSIAMGPMVSPPPQTPGQSFARDAGELTGTSIGTMTGAGAVSRALPAANAVPGAGRAAIDAMAGKVGQAPITTLLSEVLAGGTAVAGGRAGSPVGEQIAEVLGLPPEAGAAVGQTLGELLGGIGGAVGADAVGQGIRGVLADPNSKRIYEAAKMAGVKPSAGLVGNQTASYLENTAALNPLAGNIVRRPQQKQVADIGDYRDSITDSMRAPSGALPARSAQEAGVQMRDAGQGGLARLNTKLGDLTDRELNALGGKRAAIGIDYARRTLDDALPTLDPAGQTVVRDRMTQLEQMRVPGTEVIKGFTVPKGTPIDPNLDAQIRTRINSRATQLERLERLKNPSPGQVRQARNLRYRVKQDIDQIDKNLGVPAEQLNAWRMRLGQDTDTSSRVDAPVAKSAYGGVREDQRVAAARQGNSAEFDAAISEKKRLVGDTTLEEGGDLDFLKKLTSQGGVPREAHSVYGFLTQKDAGGRILRFRENVSKDEFDTAMANMIDVMGQPRSQTARASDMNTETFSPKAFMTNWQNLPESTRKAIYDSADVEEKLGYLSTLSDAVTKRGTASNPSGTAATAIIAKIFAEGAKNPVVTALTMGANTGLARAFMSEPVAKIIAGVNPTLAQEMLAILPARGAGALQTETSQ